MKPVTSSLLLGAVLAACTLGGCKDRTIDTHTTTTTTTPDTTTPVPAPAPAPATPSTTTPDSTTPATQDPGTTTIPPSNANGTGTSGTSGTRGTTGSGTDIHGNPVHPGTRNDNPDNMPHRTAPPQR